VVADVPAEEPHPTKATDSITSAAANPTARPASQVDFMDRDTTLTGCAPRHNESGAPIGGSGTTGSRHAPAR
jgi:hypothetical protein